jgi:hypothetical protein
VYVTGEDTNTGVGDAVMATARSESPVVSTSTDVNVALFDSTGSVIVDVTSAEFTIVVPATGAAGAGPGFTVTTKVKFVVAVALFRLAPSVQITCPVDPTAGSTQVHPLGGVIDANVVFGGVA